MWDQYFLKACFFVLLLGWGNGAFGQTVAYGDSMALIGILQQNCSGCWLDHPYNSNRWDTLQPVSNWPGVNVSNGRIDSLNLAFSGLSGQFVSLNSLDELLFLDCSFNLISSFQSLENLEKLSFFNCSHNQLVTLPPIDSLINLEHFECSDNQLNSLPTLNNLGDLKHLDCSRNLLSVLPSLSNCPSLINLLCSDNQLDSLPSLDNSISLQNIYCDTNRLTILPSLRNCSLLERLHCSENQLVRLPSLENCTNIVEIWCVDNRLRILPDLANCTSLRQLICHDNRLDSLPILSSCQSLEYLQCADNRLTQLPSLDNCGNLILLGCGKNQLTQLPNLDNCVNLKYLRSYLNNLTRLPNLNNCSSLESILCHYNQLSELPNLSSCPSLQDLYCSHNKLKNLPYLGACTSLNNLSCGYNELTFLHLELYSDIQNFSYGNQFFLSNFIGPQFTNQDSVPILDSAWKLLDASFTGGPNNRYRWFHKETSIPDTSISIPISTDSAINCVQNGWYTCEIKNTVLTGLTLQTQPLYIEFAEGVKCGDTNRDGKLNILDLALIGLNYGKTGPSRTDSIANDTILEASLIWRDSMGFPEDYYLHGDTLNIKHADCNGDGIINELDLDCIRIYYNHPHTPPRFLQNHQNPQMQLLASPRTERIRAIVTPQDTLIRVPYNIHLDSLPLNYDSLKVRGIIFTRPVTESPFYGIDTIWAEFGDSDFITDSTRALWLQKYHPNITIQKNDTNQFCELDTTYTHPLDVGVFHKDSAIYLKAGHNCINCIVVLDEPCSRSNYNDGTVYSLPLMLSTINVVVYAEDSAGNIIPMAANCTQDTVYINADSLVRSIVQRDTDSLSATSEEKEDEPTGNPGFRRGVRGNPDPVNNPPEWTVDENDREATTICIRDGVVIFPNPSKYGQLIRGCVYLQKKSFINLEMYSISGIPVFEINGIEGRRGYNEIQIPIEGLEPGTYLLKVKSPQLKGITRRVRVVVFP